jgi:hypothetical protein
VLPKVAVFGDRAFQEIIKVKSDPKGRALVLYKKRKRHQRALY